MNRKKTSLLAGVLAVAMLGCTQETRLTPEGSTAPTPSAEAGYIAIRLKDADGGAVRSSHRDYDDRYEYYEWFNEGTAQERAIEDSGSSNRVLLFYGDNSYYGSLGLERVEGFPENVFVCRKPAGTVVMPTRILAVLNGDPARLETLDATLAGSGVSALKEALTHLNELDASSPESIAQHEGYFTMSSTLWQGSEGTIAGVTEKEDFTFYETVEEALAPGHVIELTVERVLAKVTVKVTAGSDRDESEACFEPGRLLEIKGPNPVKIRKEYQVENGEEKDVVTGWSANIISWGINATEKNTHLFKQLAASPLEYPWVVETFYKNWNEPRLERSYWSIDENYTSGIYPDQYRIALDAEGVKAGSTNTIYSSGYDAGSGLTPGEYTLIYRSWNAFEKRSDDKYTPENTWSATLLTEQDPASSPWLRCGTHVIVTAQLLMDDLDSGVDRSSADANGYLKGVSDKYQSNGLWWTEQSLLEQSVATLLSNVYYSDTQTGLRNILEGGRLSELINNDPDNPLDEEYPLADGQGNPITVSEAGDWFELSPAFIKGGDGWVTLHLKAGERLQARHRDGSLTAVSESQVASYIYHFTNRARHYKEGRMYYAIGIKHNPESKHFTQGSAVETGSYGVVRNHWYRLTITSIEKPGVPVDDPDQPIIPNPEPDDKSLGVEVEILPWHVVDIEVDKIR